MMEQVKKSGINKKTVLLSLSDTVESILTNYDAEKLLNTIPRDYFNRDHFLPPVTVIEKRVKLKKAKSSITLSEESCNWLKGIASNQQMSVALLFNYLIENVADCGKINTKKIDSALDCYGYAVAHDRALFSRILSEYAESSFYNEDTGLSEEDVAYFLAISNTRTRDIK